jgi:hypothetical protein
MELLMNQASAAKRIACFGFVALLSLAAGIGIANAQTAVPMEAPATLDAVDFNFVGQANLGAPFQVDSGRLAETKGASAAIRNYAHLMVTSHIPVVDALNAILQRKNITSWEQWHPTRRRSPAIARRSSLPARLARREARVPMSSCWRSSAPAMMAQRFIETAREVAKPLMK